MSQIHVMAAKVTQGTRAVVPKAAPFKGMNPGAVRPLHRWTQPKVPVDMRGGRCPASELHTTILGASPHMHFADFSNRTTLHQFHHSPVVFTGMDLRSHLRNKLILRCQFCQNT